MQLRITIATLCYWCSFGGMGGVRADDQLSTRDGVMATADRSFVSLVYFDGDDNASRAGILVDHEARTGGDAYGDFGGAITGYAAPQNCLEESFYHPSCGCDWTVAAETVFLSRSSSDAVVLITDQDTGDTILGAEDFNFDHRGSPRLKLTRETCCCRGWEIGYLGVDSWFEARDGGDPISPVLQAPGIPLPSSMPGTIYRTRYGTDLHTLDINYRCQVSDWLTLVTGVRWAEINDEIHFERIAPTPTDFFQVETDNHLVGWQFGGDASLYTGARCDILTSFTAGVYLNWAEQDINAPVFAGGPVADRLSEAGQHVAFLSELGIRAVYRLCPNLQLQAGYQLLWIDGIALAPSQIPANNLVTASAALDTNGDLFLHGATLGLAVTF